MALPVLAGMAARYVGTKVIEHGVEKLAEKALSSGALKEGLGKLDVPFSPSKMLMSSMTEAPLQSVAKNALPGLK